MKSGQLEQNTKNYQTLVTHLLQFFPEKHPKSGQIEVEIEVKLELPSVRNGAQPRYILKFI